MMDIRIAQDDFTLPKKIFNNWIELYYLLKKKAEEEIGVLCELPESQYTPELEAKMLKAEKNFKKDKSNFVNL